MDTGNQESAIPNSDRRSPGLIASDPPRRIVVRFEPALIADPGCADR
jgi:hypothetical protein